MVALTPGPYKVPVPDSMGRIAAISCEDGAAHIEVGLRGLGFWWEICERHSREGHWIGQGWPERLERTRRGVARLWRAFRLPRYGQTCCILFEAFRIECRHTCLVFTFEVLTLVPAST